MSLILDALNRARHEQPAQQVPSVDSVHYSPEQRRPWLLYAVIAVLGTGLLLVLALLWGRDKTEPSITSVDATSAPVLAPVTSRPSGEITPPPEPIATPAARSMAPAALDSTTKPGVDSDVAALYQRDQNATPEPEMTGDKAPIVSGDAPVSVDEPAPKAMSGDVPATGIEETPVDVAEVLRRAQAELGSAGLSPHSVPLLENLSQQAKDRIPTVVYSVHDYAKAGESAITINGKRLTSGQRADGFLVKEILEDSAILSWGSTDFRLRALNSWINL